MKTIQPTLREIQESKIFFVDDDKSCDAEESSGAKIKGDFDYKED